MAATTTDQKDPFVTVPGDRHSEVARTLAESVPQALSLLTGLAGGARRLQDCRAGDCPPGGSTSSSKTARSAATAAAAWSGLARTR